MITIEWYWFILVILGSMFSGGLTLLLIFVFYFGLTSSKGDVMEEIRVKAAKLVQQESARKK